jgi:hypothetical protein
LIKFKQEGPKKWSIIKDKDEPIQINLLPSSVTNKFFIITDFVERVAEFHGEAFSEWFISLVKDCQDPVKRPKALTSNVDKLREFCDSYLESRNLDFNKFVDTSKAKKNSILFSADEIDKIIHLSCYLKIYAIFSNSVELSLGKNLHRTIYNKLSMELIKTDVVSKIFDIVKTKTFRYNLTDRFMWEYIKTIQSKDIGTHVIEIFNYIMNNSIILCEEDKNPITYFVGVVNESIRWFLKDVYKGNIVYEDEITTEDIHAIHINNLRTYSFNDTLGKLKSIAFEKIFDELDKDHLLNVSDDKSDQYIIDFNNRLSDIKYISPLCPSLVFPLLSKMTNISYVHFKTISPEHSTILSYYTNILLQKVFKTDFKNLFVLLDYYPESPPSISTTYKIKGVHDYIKIQDETKNFFGFNTKILPHKVLCHFIGRVSRINFSHLLSGKKMTGIPLSKVETDMINFYTLFFSGKLDKKISEMTAIMNKDF